METKMGQITVKRVSEIHGGYKADGKKSNNRDAIGIKVEKIKDAQKNRTKRKKKKSSLEDFNS